MTMNDTLQIEINEFNTSTVVVEKLLQKIVLGCLLSTLSIFTVCGNVLVLYAIRTEKNLRTVSNLFILSLAFADLAVGLFVMPLSAATIIAGRWPFSSVICKMWLSIDYVASTASIFNLVLLSLDRYWAVVYPLRYLRKRTRRRATIFILIVWLVSFLWAPAVIFWPYIAPHHSDVIRKDECDTSFRSNKTFKTIVVFVNFYMPLLTMIIISCRIMVAIRSRSKMELGRRLSSTTQRQMKGDRANTLSLPRDDMPMHYKSDTTNGYSLSSPPPTTTDIPTPAMEYPSIVNTDNVSVIPMVEPGQCFCSTCQVCDGNDSISLWELQENRKKKSSSALRRHLSIAQLKPISMIFSSARNLKENKNAISQEFSKSVSDNDQRMKNARDVENNLKYTIIVNPNEHLQHDLLPTIDKKAVKPSAAIRSSSITSSFSDDFNENVFTYSTGKQSETKAKGKKPITSFTTSENSPLTTPRLKLPSSILKDSITTLGNYSSIVPPTPTTTTTRTAATTTQPTFCTFFNTLINPSRSNSLQKELKAARQLGMLVGVFTVSWLPYFILFLVVAWCNGCVSDTVYIASIWLGYLNSTFNPLIYPLCNTHFRQAFQKICYCKHAKTKLPNLAGLRELHTLHSMSRRR